VIGAIRLSRSGVETGGRSAARTRACAGSRTGDADRRRAALHAGEGATLAERRKGWHFGREFPFARRKPKPRSVLPQGFRNRKGPRQFLI
jgi:hypothetical protein